MLFAKYTITWADGQRTFAEIEAESAEADYPVQYTGAYDRLVPFDPPAQSDVAFLSFVMRDAAERGGGKFTEDLTGQYDRHAGGREGL